MTRWLLILALTCTGLAPGAHCFYAAHAAPTVAADDCGMTCCGMTCCCVEDADPLPTPDAPATPPRVSDTLAPIFFSTALALPAWDDDPGQQSPTSSYTSAIRSRERRAVPPMICRWLT